MEIIVYIFGCVVVWFIWSIWNDTRKRARIFVDLKEMFITNLGAENAGPSVSCSRELPAPLFEAAIRLKGHWSHDGWNKGDSADEFFKAHVMDPQLLEFIVDLTRECTQELDFQEVEKWVTVISWIFARNWMGENSSFVFLRGQVSGLLGESINATDGMMFEMGGSLALVGYESIQDECFEYTELERGSVKIRITSQDDHHVYATISGLVKEENRTHSIELLTPLDKTERSNGYIEKDASKARIHLNTLSSWVLRVQAK